MILIPTSYLQLNPIRNQDFFFTGMLFLKFAETISQKIIK